MKHTGSGRYIKNLIIGLLKTDKNNQYVLFVDQKQQEEVKKDLQALRLPINKAKLVALNIPHYSLKEQLLFPIKLYREQLDLVHFPQFNLPVFYFGKFVVTIHDLIKHFFRGTDNTTRSPWLYWLKYLGYQLVFGLAVKRAQKIIAPSYFVKNELVRKYGLNSNKIAVTYEGVDQALISRKLKIKNKTHVLSKYRINKPYLLYVGNVYPHKNVESLIEAVKLVNNGQRSVADSWSLITLVIVCARSVFWERLKKKIREQRAEEYINLVGFVPDEELAEIYHQAEAFIFPTLSEGFGLPGLEAMAQGLPIAASNIPVLKEVYKDAAFYFDPYNSKDMAEKIKKLLTDKKLQERLKKRGLGLIKNYSWQKMATETLLVYNHVLKI